MQSPPVPEPNWRAGTDVAAAPVLTPYVASGRVPWTAWAMLAAVIWPAAAVVGWLYALVLTFFESQPMRFLVALVLWLVLSAMASGLVQARRSRSVAFNRFAGASIGVVALWAHWIVVLKASGRGDLAATFLGSGPLGWFHVLGDWLSSEQELHPASALAATVRWSLEAAATILIPAAAAAGQARKPYSETRHAWAREAFKGELLAPGASSAGFEAAFRRQGLQALAHMSPASTAVAEPVAFEWWTWSSRVGASTTTPRRVGSA